MKAQWQAHNAQRIPQRKWLVSGLENHGYLVKNKGGGGRKSPPPHTESCGLRATRGKRASSAKQNPHQWYQRRLSVWKKMCNRVWTSPSRHWAAAAFAEPRPTENTVSVDTALTINWHPTPPSHTCTALPIPPSPPPIRTRVTIRVCRQGLFSCSHFDPNRHDPRVVRHLRDDPHSSGGVVLACSVLPLPPKPGQPVSPVLWVLRQAGDKPRQPWDPRHCSGGAKHPLCCGGR